MSDLTNDDYARAMNVASRLRDLPVEEQRARCRQLHAEAAGDPKKRAVAALVEVDLRLPIEVGHRTVIGSGNVKYELGSLLGAGGMGSVHLANRVGKNNRRAVKLIRATRAGDDEVVRRFREEIATVADLSDPKYHCRGLVHFYEDGLYQDPATGRRLPFFAMEYVPGARPITEWAAGQPVKERLRCLAEACDALGAAHAAGVLHCDLKPGNVVVGDNGAAYVLDFGLARAMGRAQRVSAADGGDRGGDNDEGPSEWLMSGTPEYLSPEQVSAEHGPATFRTDVYGLGLIAYEVFAGRLPHDETHDNLPALRAAILRGSVPDLSPLPDVRGKHTARLTGVLRTALAARPADRYPTVGKFKEALEQVARQIDEDRIDDRISRYVWRAAVAVILLLGTVAVIVKWTGRTKETGGTGRAGAGEASLQPPEPADLLHLTPNGTFRIPDTTFEFALIKPGTFDMGSTPDEEIAHPSRTDVTADEIRKIREWEQRHRATVERPFYMGVAEVTQAQWRQVMGEAANTKFRGDALPVESVSWQEAMTFCARLGARYKRKFRLPSEVEWEYACRAGTSTPFHFGPTLPVGEANFDSNLTYKAEPARDGLPQTTPVKTYKPNAFGLYDMHGNVCEWCLDPDGEYPRRPAQPVAEDLDVAAMARQPPHETFAVRGGAFEASAQLCRSANRWAIEYRLKGEDIGFRIVLEP